MRRRITWALTRLLALGTVLASGTVAQGGDLVQPPLTFDIEHYDVDRLVQAADSGEPFTLQYFGAAHSIRVERNDVRAERYRAHAVGKAGVREILPMRSRLYKGRVVGEPMSLVRLSIDRRGVRGYIRASEGWTFIEPEMRAPGSAPARLGDETPHRVWNEDDIDSEFQGTCSETPAPSAHVGEEPHTESRKHSVRESADAHAESATFQELEIAVVADYEFYQAHGDNTASEIETTLNAVEGVYEAELGITVRVVSLMVWEEEEDPYTQTNANDLLLELRDYWNLNRGSVARDIVHLFTGKNLEGTTVGIAYVGAVCDLADSYSLSQDISSSALEPLLVAHEIGHALGASHDASGTSTRYVMYPSLGSSNLDEFSDESTTAIGNYLNTTTCLSVVDEGDGGVDTPTSPGSGGTSGGSGSGSTPAPSGRRGGGPIDPLSLLALAAGAAYAGWRRPRRES